MTRRWDKRSRTGRTAQPGRLARGESACSTRSTIDHDHIDPEDNTEQYTPLTEADLDAIEEIEEDARTVGVPLLSSEIVGECRFIRRADQPDSADLGVTVVDAWQGRGLGSALLACLSERALEVGIEYFTAEVLAENRTVLSILPSLGEVETESSGPVVTARIEIPQSPGPAGQDFLDLLIAAARGQMVVIPAPLRRLIHAPDEFPDLAHIVRLPVTALLKALRLRSPGS